MYGFRGALYREYKLLAGNRTNLLLGASLTLIYILLFSTSMTRLIKHVEYRGNAVRYADFILPALLVFSMVSAATTAAYSLFQERMARMDLELWSYPLSKAGFVAAKLVANTGMVLLQVFLALALAISVFRLTWSVSDVPVLLVSCITSAATLLGLYMLLATVISSFQRFSVTISILGFVMFFASESFYTVQNMPTVVRAISWINPMQYAIRAVRDSFVLTASKAIPSNVGLAVAASLAWLLVVRGLVRRARSL